MKRKLRAILWDQGLRTGSKKAVPSPPPRGGAQKLNIPSRKIKRHLQHLFKWIKVKFVNWINSVQGWKNQKSRCNLGSLFVRPNHINVWGKTVPFVLDICWCHKNPREILSAVCPWLWSNKQVFVLPKVFQCLTIAPKSAVPELSVVVDSF